MMQQGAGAMPFGMPEMPAAAKANGQDQIPQAITAAMLMAAKNGCTCQVCQIMRGVIDKMAAPFLPGNQPPAQGV